MRDAFVRCRAGGTAGWCEPFARMPAKPKTINDYKAALLKLKVSLPAKNAKLADYEKLWTQATTPAPVATAAPPSAPRSKRKAPAVASKSPAAQRQRRPSAGDASHVPPSVASLNLPLSQQRASPNVPLSQQRAAPARASPNIPLSQQRAAPARTPPNIPLSQQRPALVPIPLQPPAVAPPAAVPWSMPLPGFGMAGASGFAAFGLGGDRHTLTLTLTLTLTPTLTLALALTLTLTRRRACAGAVGGWGRRADPELLLRGGRRGGAGGGRARTGCGAPRAGTPRSLAPRSLPA